MSLLATCCYSPAEVALLAPEIPNTYDEAMSPDNKKNQESRKRRTLLERTTRSSELSATEHERYTVSLYRVVIPCRYVFRVKKDVVPKVRIVVKGFRQVAGVDYNETYAPVVSTSIVRLFLCVVNLHNLECDQNGCCDSVSKR